MTIASSTSTFAIWPEYLNISHSLAFSCSWNCWRRHTHYDYLFCYSQLPGFCLIFILPQHCIFYCYFPIISCCVWQENSPLISKYFPLPFYHLLILSFLSLYHHHSSGSISVYSTSLRIAKDIIYILMSMLEYCEKLADCQMKKLAFLPNILFSSHFWVLVW